MDLGNNYENEDQLCVVCFREAEFYSIGECDHPVCHECSTRMRVICERTECPICRKDMSLVVFVHTIQNFSKTNYRNMKCERRYLIYFEDDHIMRSYDQLLEHRCILCIKLGEFRNFRLLKDHMRKVHESFYCDLCVDNLKIFTHERKIYTRSSLAQHRRLGDPDDTSHRGHPLCEFCDSRFMDKDELYRHLRRDHFFCHFCDADGCHNYYSDYNALRDHFRQDHFLCEEDNCREERFISVFRTKLDLQAHKTQNHGQHMTKSEARLARTVDIEFNISAHRPQSGPAERGKGNRRPGPGENRRRRPQDDIDDQEMGATSLPPTMVKSKQSIDISCAENFPSLSGVGGNVLKEADSGGNKSIARRLAQQNRLTVRMSKGNPMSEEEFPSLGSTTVASSAKSSSANNGAASTTYSTVSNSNSHNSSSKKTNRSQNSCQGLDLANSHIQNQTSINSSKGNDKQNRNANIANSGNVSYKTSTGGPSPQMLSEDFPSLPKAKKAPPVQSSATWVPHQSKETNSTKLYVKGQSASNDDSNNNSTTTTNNYSFQSGDFPSLGPSSKDYMSQSRHNSSITVQTNPGKHLGNEENMSNTSNKKKQKGNNDVNNSKDQNKTIKNSNNSDKSVTPSVKSKKKIPLALNNMYEEEENGPVEDFSWGRQGDYEAVISMASSNINFVSADQMSGKKTAKNENSECQGFDPADFGADDFPSLFPNRPNSGKDKKIAKNISLPKNKLTNQLSYNKTSVISKTEPNAPLGFTHIKSVNNTSSSTSQILSKKSDKNKTLAPTHDFTYPSNFESRNKALIDAVNSACLGNDDSFNKFKFLAGMFRKGEILGENYYVMCRQTMGKELFLKILPELLSLLPDITKQQAVLEAYRSIDNGEGCDTCFAVCAVCQQVLKSDDFTSHMLVHEFASDKFPAFKSTGNSVQRRK